MADKRLEQAALEQLGEPGTVARELAQFRRAAKALSSRHPRFIEAYPRQWVVVHDGRVVARGQSLHSALLQARQQNLPTEKAVVRYIHKSDRTFIL